ncbi:MFS transporter [Carboxylicivirga sediminis]|uniref:MFS transporter n=1 Tax=Carboxylicivirga sediminis TaxID=2006564 RepID=A0A941F1W7_9BACT|nr:MFS transporter [Carboxylicivirga sediminis]MBR8535211.1 MFS transporter [Carboxylicivirga sediminis]
MYSGNITKLYLIKIAKWFMLTMPIMMLFFQDLGFTVEESFQLKAIYSIAIVIFEIPSGYAADVLGRRRTLIIGSIMGTLGFAIYSFTSGFYAFLAAELILGIGQSFISGADSALLYDSLKADGREQHYLKYEGRNFSVGNFSEAIAGFLGGALAEISLRTPFFFQTGIAFIAIPAAFMLVEPQLYTRTQKATWRDILNVVKYAMVTNRSLRYNIIYSSIIGSATLTMAWVYPLYLKEIGFREIHIGTTSTVLNLVVGMTTLFAYKIEQKLRPKSTVWGTTLVITGAFIAAGLLHSIYVLPVMICFYFSRGIATPVLKDYINRITSSDMRATVLSIRSLIIRANFSVLAPLFGYMTDRLTLSQAFVIIGIIFTVLTGSSIFLFLRSLERDGS